MYNVVTLTPALVAAAYAAHDNLGTKMSFTVPPARSMNIVGAWLLDADKQAAGAELTLFSADPSASTFTDNAATAVVKADLPKIIANVSFPVTNLVTFSATHVLFGSNSPATTFGPLRVPMYTRGISTIYAALKTLGTPTYSAADSLKIKLILDPVRR